MGTKKKNAKRVEPTIPEALNTPEFAAAWAEWLRFAQDRGTPMAEDAAARQLKLLAKLGADKAIADIRKTMQEPVPDQAEGAKKGKRGQKVEAPTDDAAKTDETLVKPAEAATKGKKAPKEPKAKKMSPGRRGQGARGEGRADELPGDDRRLRGRGFLRLRRTQKTLEIPGIYGGSTPLYIRGATTKYLTAIILPFRKCCKGCQHNLGSKYIVACHASWRRY